ncbi:hypothetical protein ACFE04_030368 [Oxalis oulophora]
MIESNIIFYDEKKNADFPLKMSLAVTKFFAIVGDAIPYIILRQTMLKFRILCSISNIDSSDDNHGLFPIIWDSAKKNTIRSAYTHLDSPNYMSLPHFYA